MYESLKSCPFCDGDPRWEHDCWEDNGDIGGDLYITCGQCYSTGSNYTYENIEERETAYKDAAIGWNRRVP